MAGIGIQLERLGFASCTLEAHIYVSTRLHPQLEERQDEIIDMEPRPGRSGTEPCVVQALPVHVNYSDAAPYGKRTAVLVSCRASCWMQLIIGKESRRSAGEGWYIGRGGTVAPGRR